MLLTFRDHTCMNIKKDIIYKLSVDPCRCRTFSRRQIQDRKSIQTYKSVFCNLRTITLPFYFHTESIALFNKSLNSMILKYDF